MLSTAQLLLLSISQFIYVVFFAVPCAWWESFWLFYMTFKSCKNRHKKMKVGGKKFLNLMNGTFALSKSLFREIIELTKNNYFHKSESIAILGRLICHVGVISNVKLHQEDQINWRCRNDGEHQFPVERKKAASYVGRSHRQLMWHYWKLQRNERKKNLNLRSSHMGFFMASFMNQWASNEKI